MEGGTQEPIEAKPAGNQAALPEMTGLSMMDGSEISPEHVILAKEKKKPNIMAQIMALKEPESIQPKSDEMTEKYSCQAL